MDPYIPFCGTPPGPAELWTRWTFDPWLMGGLGLFAALLAMKATDRRAAVLGWALTALLFVSPICAASMALFSARVTQHVILVLIAAPLVARALPALRLPVLPLAGLMAAIFWAWHLPGPYGATLKSDLLYWAMHLTTFGAAILLWSGVRGAVDRDPGPVALALALTAAQMTLLSVLLVVSREVWHGWHRLTTEAYGIDAMADQHLAGGIMWAASAALMLAVIGTLTWRFVGKAQPEETEPLTR